MKWFSYHCEFWLAFPWVQLPWQRCWCIGGVLALMRKREDRGLKSNHLFQHCFLWWRPGTATVTFVISSIFEALCKHCSCCRDAYLRLGSNYSSSQDTFGELDPYVITQRPQSASIEFGGQKAIEGARSRCDYMQHCSERV